MKTFLLLALSACTIGCKAQAQTKNEVVTPMSVSVQMILDSVQAKYPGNEWVKKCGPANHDGACFDPSIRHLTFHIYGSKRHCEQGENVKCTELDDWWIPIGKPVAEMVTKPEGGAKP